MPDAMTNLQLFRDLAGLNQQELGSVVKVTRQTIAAWEKGEREPSALQLARLAKVLHVSLESLLGMEEEQETVLLFRADNPQVLSRGVRQLLSEKAEDYAAIERYAGVLPVLPEARPLSGFEEEIVERVAVEVRDWLGVERAPLGNVIQLLENKGLKIILDTLPAEVSGFSAYTEELSGIIVVNAGHALERQYFTCLHELGHLIFHRREYSVPSEPARKRGDPREKTAHRFASATLLPREIMTDELGAFAGRWIPEPVLVDMKLRYRVSQRTVVFRAGDLGLISKQQAGQQVGVINKLYGLNDERPKLTTEEDERRPMGRLQRLTYRALLADRISESRAAEVLAVPLAEIRQQLQGYLANPALDV